MIEQLYISNSMLTNANYRKTHRMMRIAIFTILISCSVANAFAQQVTISNNLLYDAWLTPNLRVGYRLSPHWSIGLTGG